MGKKVELDLTSALVESLVEPPKLIPIPPLPTSIPIPNQLRAADLENFGDVDSARPDNLLGEISRTFDQMYVHFFQIALRQKPNSASARKEAQRAFISHVQVLAQRQHFQVNQVSVKDDSPYGGEHDVLFISATIPVDGKPTKVAFYSRPLRDYTSLDFIANLRK
ncbi:hypothetical protein KBD71_01035 [Candidatus Woesebacteria bacterium]|nr:hypothetical protein [Candidatus Woesebacteria bacterium]